MFVSLFILTVVVEGPSKLHMCLEQHAHSIYNVILFLVRID